MQKRQGLLKIILRVKLKGFRLGCYTFITIFRIYNIHINTQISNVITIALANEALKGDE